MANFRLSLRADADLARIADYTIETFGIEQARRYRWNPLPGLLPIPYINQLQHGYHIP